MQKKKMAAQREDWKKLLVPIVMLLLYKIWQWGGFDRPVEEFGKQEATLSLK